ncbi:MAG: insulinase family protein, partial [Myxococcota bacterium]
MAWWVSLVTAAFAQNIAVGEHLFYVETLDNGLRAMAVEDGPAEELTLFVVYSVGNQMEEAGQFGLAHLVEHALFSGTAATPSGAVVQTIEALGGESNAYTRDDYTAYYAHRIPAASLPDILALEADRMRGLVFRSSDVEEEQQSLVREEQKTSRPELQIDTRRNFTVYGGRSYGAGVFDAEGNSDAARLPLGAIRGFYDRWYHPQRAAVVVVGGEPEASLRAIRTAFAEVPRGPGDLGHSLSLDARPGKPTEVSWSTALTRDRLEWVWHGPSLAEHPDRLALEALATAFRQRTAPDGSPVEVLVDGHVASSLFVMAATGDDAAQSLRDLHEEILAGEFEPRVLDEARRILGEAYRDRTLRGRPYFSLAVDVAVLSRWGLADLPGTLPERLAKLTTTDLREAARRWLQPAGRWVVRFEADEAQSSELPETNEALAAVGESAMKSGDLPLAIRVYETLLDRGANRMNTVIYRYYLGSLNYRLGQLDEARRQLLAGLEVVEYPALRELLSEVEDAQGSGRTPHPDPEPGADAPRTPKSGRTVRATRGASPPAWVSEANAVMAQLEDWRQLPFVSDLVLELSTELQPGLAGFYASDTGRLVVGLGNSERFNQGTMLHEMFHALQDQHFDLSALHDRAGADVDAQRALSALIEGEAMLAVSELMDYDFLAHATIPADGPLDEGRFERIFRYGDGLRFV